MEGIKIKQLSDGRFVASQINPSPGTMYGDYVKIEGEITENKLTKAKKLLVKQICQMIEDIAENREDFFIIKEMEDGFTTVGCKFILPTVNDK